MLRERKKTNGLSHAACLTHYTAVRILSQFFAGIVGAVAA